jgi:hypothetical protein
MPAMLKAVSLLTISAVLLSSVGHVIAKTASPGQVKTSGTSATPSGAGGSQSKTRACRYHHCVTVPRTGTTPGGGADPNRGGVDNPALHPK